MFANPGFSASGRTWDGLEYKLSNTETKSRSTVLVFSVSGAPTGSIHIPQIVGPWDSTGQKVKAILIPYVAMKCVLNEFLDISI